MPKLSIAMPKLSIVVGTYNRLDQIRRCINSIFDQTTTNFRLYVTDAGSTDGTTDYLRSVACDKLIPILVGRKLGQAKAYNDVFNIVDTPYVCWLSDDNVIVNKGLNIAVSILEADQRLGMVGLKTKDVRGPFIDAPYIGGVSPIGILNVNQGMLPTPVLKQVGGFSEAFRDYGIDPDLTAKVLFAGYDIVFTREVTILHYRNWGDRSPASIEHAELKQKHERFRILYEEKFGRLANKAPIWRLRCAAWSFITKAGRSIKNAWRFKNKARRPIKNAWRLFKKTWWFKNRVSRFIRKLMSVTSSIRLAGRQGARDWHNMLTVRGFESGKSFANRQSARDWHNVFTARYISLLDPLHCAGKPYYLRQHCPRYLRPKAMLQDPVHIPAVD